MFIHVDMGIYLRGGYTAMPQQILDVFDIHILFQQQCGKSVAESTRSDFFPIPVSSRHRLINSLTDCEDSLFPNLFIKNIRKEQTDVDIA